jgi:predicted transposase/invertase (TIGR01784 family)
MKANRQHKASVFAFLFSEPARLRELYNALAGTNYDESAHIVINTLSDVVFMNRINDLSFTINDKLVVLIEHQSTINPNMSIRLLFYIARIYEKLIDNKKLYSRAKVTIPRPEFIVLYNGPDNHPDESTMKLSDHFENGENYANIDLELQVRVYNINKGRNPKLEQQSKSLGDYAMLIAKIREYELSGLARGEALKQAVQWCIKQGYLQDFLKIHSSEVVNMLITEWNWDDAKEVWHEEGVAEGIEKGLAKGSREKQLEIARKMKQAGLDMEQIFAFTGLSPEEITRL